jgi:hypothetical protein
MTAENRTWQELCEAASQESDPTQLMEIVAELMQALDERDRLAKPNVSQGLHPPHVS